MNNPQFTLVAKNYGVGNFIALGTDPNEVETPFLVGTERVAALGLAGAGANRPAHAEIDCPCASIGPLDEDRGVNTPREQHQSRARASTGQGIEHKFGVRSYARPRRQARVLVASAMEGIMGKVLIAVVGLVIGIPIGAFGAMTRGVGAMAVLATGACSTVKAASGEGIMTADEVDTVLNRAAKDLAAMSGKPVGEEVVGSATACEQVLARLRAAQ